ncbi:MAG: signal peptide peptidase SppA [Alphaproteobacteria bacterium]
MLRFLSQFIASLLAFLVVLFVIIPGLVVWLVASEIKPLPDTMVLTLDLRRPIPDKSDLSLFGRSGPDATSVVGIVRALEQAERDPRVRGVYLQIGDSGLSLAAAQELREALGHFKDAGKSVFAHTQSLFSAGLGAYSLAAAADNFSLQPGGILFTSGLSTNTLFFKSAFERIGVQPSFRGYGEYKSGINPYLEDDYPDTMREARTALLTSTYEQAVTDLADMRGIAASELKDLFSDAPVLADRALSLNLVDAVRHEAEARQEARKAGGADARLVTMKAYLRDPFNTRDREGATTVALVHASGAIVEGGGNDGGIPDADEVGADVFSRAIARAVSSPRIKALILRVDSPGGSPLASEQIRHALLEAQAAGKPVIVSMAGVAASGGYWISMSADRILAHPATVTGSIGVYGGKFAIGETLNKLGITFGELASNDGALLLSPKTPFDDDQWARFDRYLLSVYDDFIAKGSEGRDLSPEVFEQHARGRVWSGVDALERNLIDRHGGLRTAMAEVRETLNLSETAPLVLRDYPAKPGLADLIAALMSASAGAVRAGQVLDEVMTLVPADARRKVSAVLGSDDPVVYEETGPIR